MHTTFIVLASLALGIQTLILFLAFFGPDLSYHVRQEPREEIDSGYFLSELAALSDAQIHRENTIEVLTNGGCFYEAQLAAIRSAQRTINLEAYIFHRGKIAPRFIEALTERARRGVKVKVTIDYIGSYSTFRSYFRDLLAAGAQLPWYHSLRLDLLPLINNRTHREMLIVDGRIGFVGGAGIADQWYTGVKDHPRWRDTVVRVEGPLVSSLQSVFAQNWLRVAGEILTGEEYFSFPQGSGRATGLIVSSTPSEGSTRARTLFQVLIASASKYIYINTPYFLPDLSARQAIVSAVRNRGVKVKIITPGRRSDHAFTRNSSRTLYGPLLKQGIEIYEYQPAMIHVKALMVDGCWAVVGSTNFDHRSFELNEEVNLAILDPAVTQRLVEDFEQDLSECHQVTYEAWRRAARRFLRPATGAPQQTGMNRFRLATYNVHKCRGLDMRVSAFRILKIMEDIGADIFALQEIFEEQAHFLSDRLGTMLVFGPARTLDSQNYGNAILSRGPVLWSRSHDLSIARREPRSCLRADVQIAENLMVHVFAVHLGTSYFERRHQARKLVSPEILESGDAPGLRIMTGDFNEWTKGVTTRTLSEHMRRADLASHFGRRRSYPGLLPILHLDHMYYDASLQLVSLRLHRTLASLVASDHLPLLGDFEVSH
ncbi:MAG: endonuclease/exonuclease/phosphatase family protein [Acidobacteriaceae bacterium]|nr:endonuclease/exonuclease/phosphatase family protein [Acidobacteriaceae bacterium]MBV9500042.1 endonuclease/exonuclease/phosphatase family protein [Acidobacteriaceae bacterium]